MAIKVLHISSSTYGGAGIAAVRIHHALLAQGVDSRMLVMEDSLHENEIEIAQSTAFGRIVVPNIPLIRRIARRCRENGLFLTRLEKMEWMNNNLEKRFGVYFSLPISSYRIEEHPLIRWADIIHIHWIQNFINFDTFFKSINKPILWTIHDQNPLFGGFHHMRLREKFYSIYKELEDECMEIKKKSLCGVESLSVVAISSEMHTLLFQHPLFSKRQIFDIPNCIPVEQFTMLECESVRKKLYLCTDIKCFLFVNRNLNDNEKGLAIIIQALEKMRLPNSVLVCVGDGMVPATKYLSVVHMSATDDVQLLCEYYNAADVLLMPSYQESFGNTVIEAMYCGIPVVMNRVGVAEDIICPQNGVISDGFDVDSWIIAINKSISLKYDRQKIRNIAIDKFSFDVVGGKYINVYHQMLKQ